MKKNKTVAIPKANLAITEQKLYQRKIKTEPVEQQTLRKEFKKEASKKK